MTAAAWYRARSASATSNGRSPRVSASHRARTQRVVGLRADGAPCPVELLRTAFPRQRLERMNAEPPLVRVEGAKLRGSADVCHPLTERDALRDLTDDVIGDAEEHQLGRRIRVAPIGDAEAALGQARPDGAPGPAGPDDVHRVEHVGKSRCPASVEA